MESNSIGAALSAGGSIEVANVFRQYIGQYRARYPMPLAHLKVAGAILNCRTAFLGGHVQRCNRCGVETIAYNSCRNRHCPKCQCLTKERWLQARKAELLPTRYFHVVFTLPHALNALVLCNKTIMLKYLFKASADTLLAFGHNELGGQLGIIAVLHTWDQKLRDHFHLHCLVPAGALCHNKSRWNHCHRDFLFPVKALSIVFRQKYMDYLKITHRKKQLSLPGQTKALSTDNGFKDLVARCYENRWVVNIRKPIEKPEYVLDYLGRYTHRVAISNNRIVAMENSKVSFTYKNRKTGQILQERIDAVEFIRRFLLHVLPKGFMRIRHFGFLANRCKKEKIRICRRLLGSSAALVQVQSESVQQVMFRLTGIDIMRCPNCKKGIMICIAKVLKGTCTNILAVLQPP